MVEVLGFEPVFKPVVVRSVVNPKRQGRMVSPPPCVLQMEPTRRIELPTCSLRMSCSTTELRWHDAFD